MALSQGLVGQVKEAAGAAVDRVGGAWHGRRRPNG
jgi:hypothetical protein